MKNNVVIFRTCHVGFLVRMRGYIYLAAESRYNVHWSESVFRSSQYGHTQYMVVLHELKNNQCVVGAISLYNIVLFLYYITFIQFN
jgi:hypothetical protein